MSADKQQRVQELFVIASQRFFTTAEIDELSALYNEGYRHATTPSDKGGEATDTARLDWLDSDAHEIGTDGQVASVVRAWDGETFFGPTLREAIDAAMRPTPPKATEGIIHCKGDGSLGSDNA